MNSTTGVILTSLAGRPNFRVRSTMSARNSCAAGRFGRTVKITSQFFAAKSRPDGDIPAWNSTGRPCGLTGSCG